ncbi:hypothetical protein DVJ83_17695 (plasmid) [Deinococcus wulumuqiensis]|uniref:Uncharacterized protein n=1 Tax=Deinococcus wulumuqiensis TaxID=980427 RepID=A0A345IML5_9DEIO|nr:hypothetical protein [Deinococcus wulumuqiensis]AXH00938.1 hypothetical protein DVJ83_17695 [Deinococcus wulumuqiensis]
MRVVAGVGDVGFALAALRAIQFADDVQGIENGIECVLEVGELTEAVEFTFGDALTGGQALDVGT